MNTKTLLASRAAGAVAFIVALPIATHLEQGRVNALRGRESASEQARADARAAVELQAFNEHDRDMKARLTAAMFAGDCTTSDTWRTDHTEALDLPASMVVQLVTADGKFTWQLEARPWSMDAKGDLVKLLCVKPAASMKAVLK